MNLGSALWSFSFRLFLCVGIGLSLFSYSYSEKLSIALDNLRFDWFEESEDFASIGVMALHQDRYGFIWVGTRDGLYRYDGERFLEYRSGGEERLSLPRNQVDRIFEDSKGNLWVGLQAAVVRYDYEMERFVEHEVAGYLQTCVHFSENDEGRLFMMNQNGTVFELDESGVFRTVESLEEDWARCSTVSEDGTVFVGGKYGIRQYSSELEELRFIDAAEILEDANNSFVTALAKSGNDTLWIGTSRYGVWRLDLQSGQFTKMPTRSMDEDRVGSILIDERGVVLVGTTAGLTLYSDEGAFLKMYEWSRYNPRSIPTGTVYSMLNDRQGNLWFGTSRGGLSVVRNSKKFEGFDITGKDSESLTKQKVTAILVDSLGRLWAGYHNESLDRFNFDLGTKTFFDAHSPGSGALGRGTVWDIAETSDGSIWVGTNRGGLSWLKPGSDRFHRFVPDADDPTSIGALDLRAILPDEDDNLWLLLHGAGISHLDRESMEFTLYDDFAQLWVEDFVLSSNGDLWVGSTNGLSVLRKGADNFVPYGQNLAEERGLPTNHVICLAEDSSGSLWVGTRNGLCVKRPGEEGFQRFGRESGLPSLEIRSVVQADSGEIWVATAGGLTRFNLTTQLFRAFFKGDGLLSNEFVARSSFVDGAGTVLLGCERGVVAFKPEAIKINENAPRSIITGFSLFSEPVYPSSEDGALLKKSTITNEQIVLPPGKTTFGFQFAALDYVSGGRVEYEYTLEGFDSRWISNGNRSDCYYTNITPGEYVFRVRASNSDGVWEKEGIAMSVVVLPFFWQTNWFIAIVVVLLVLFFVFLIRARTANLARQKIVLLDTVSERTKDLQDALYELELQKAQIEDQNLELLDHRENLEELVEQRTSELVAAKERAEESDRLKSSFLENISHEIRTPMNAIMGFVNILKMGDSDEEEEKEYFEIVEENGESLIALIDDIIEISLLESSKAELSFVSIELHTYFNKWQAYLKSELSKFKKGGIRVRLEFEGSDEIPIKLEIDPARFDQVLKNLLDNAIKFTDSGSIEIVYGLQENLLECRVSDTGIGIPSSKLSDVFNLFRKLSMGKERLYRGTGLGLAIAKRVMNLMGGEIEVESEQGKGTRFSLRVPVRNLKREA